MSPARFLWKPTASVAVRTIRAKREGHGRPGRADTGVAISQPCEHAARRVLNCRPLPKFFSTPSGCPTGVDSVFLEMITKILFAIQASMRCFRPQTQIRSRFARQSEFVF